MPTTVSIKPPVKEHRRAGNPTNDDRHLRRPPGRPDFQRGQSEPWL